MVGVLGCVHKHSELVLFPGVCRSEAVVRGEADASLGVTEGKEGSGHRVDGRIKGSTHPVNDVLCTRVDARMRECVCV